MPKIYTVVTMIQYDYDFSVESTKHGAFFNRDNALAKLKEVVEKHKNSIANHIEKYSNKEEYYDEDAGAYTETEDYDNNYWCCYYGTRDHRVVHQVTIEEFDIEDELPNKVTYGGENKKKCVLTLCSDDDNPAMVFANLTPKQIKMIEKDLAGELNAEFTFTTIDGQTFESGIVDKITILD